jgi:hypothetical protein
LRGVAGIGLGTKIKYRANCFCVIKTIFLHKQKDQNHISPSFPPADNAPMRAAKSLTDFFAQPRSPRALVVECGVVLQNMEISPKRTSGPFSSQLSHRIWPPLHMLLIAPLCVVAGPLYTPIKFFEENCARDLGFRLNCAEFLNSDLG